MVNKVFADRNRETQGYRAHLSQTQSGPGTLHPKDGNGQYVSPKTRPELHAELTEGK